eukprot:926029_1
MWHRDPTGRLVRISIAPSRVNEASDSPKLQDLIKLRLTLNKLTDSEWIRFKNEWVASLDRDTICSSIYHYLDQNITRNHNYNLATIQQTASNILQSRRETASNCTNDNDDIVSIRSLTLEPRPISPPYCIQLNHLPTVLIGDIASYLEWRSYMKLERASRQMYIGCNSPSTLHCVWTPIPAHLTQVPYMNYDHDFRSKFPLLKGFAASVLYLNHYMQCHPSNEQFNHLTTFRIMQVQSPEILQTFMASNNLIRFENITTLMCDTVMDMRYHEGVTINNNTGGLWFQQAFDSNQFMRFVKKFTHLEELQLLNVSITDDIDTDELMELYSLLPNLRRFVSRNSTPELVDSIIFLYGAQMESLSLSNHDCSLIQCEDGFPNLIELSIPLPPLNVLLHILEKPTKLERFGLIPDADHVDSLEMVRIFVKVLTTQPSLQYIGLNVEYRQLDVVMNSIKLSFTRTRHIGRDEFMVGVHVLHCNEVVIRKANVWITELMKEFKRTNIRHFRLRLLFSGDEGMIIDDRNARNRMVREWRNIYLYEVMHEQYDMKTGTAVRFTVSNKNCTINGYATRWLSLLQ